MADRSWMPPLGSLDAGVVELFCKITVGTTGSVSAGTGNGVASVALAATGQYTITLSDKYTSLLWAGVTLLDDTDSAATTVGIGTRLQAEAVATDKTITVQTYALDDGADAAPASGAILYVAMKLKNSSV